MILRDYQQEAIDKTFDYLYANPDKNPCVVCPTGSGKSVIIAEFCRVSLTKWSNTRILMLTHQKELIEQDAKALKALYPEADIGIYSASIGKKEKNHAITYASIQSIYRAKELDRFDIFIVDEAHLINNKEEGMYRKFIARMTPSFVIGFTATPYRLGQGMITDEGAVFNDIIDVISIEDLQNQGYLARLRSKAGANKYDFSTAHIKMGDFADADIQAITEDFESNKAACAEIVKTGTALGRLHWLIFCTGIDHAKEISEILNSFGVKTTYITGEMDIKERTKRLDAFTSGNVTAITNANVLTTGFDYPAIDLIALMRPTLSPGLYLQMVGRGLRTAEGKTDCLVLDFAGNVMRHGPVTSVKPPKSGVKHREGSGVPPCKECPKCLELLPANATTCPACGYEFPKKETNWELYNGDINGDDYYAEKTVPVISWHWYKAVSKAGYQMIVIEYVCLGMRNIKEYVNYNHVGYAYDTALRAFFYFCKVNHVNPNDFQIKLQSHAYLTKDEIKEHTQVSLDWTAWMNAMAKGKRPVAIRIKRKKGDYFEVTKRLFEGDVNEA